MTTPRLSVIIPVWNCWHLTKACLHALRENTPGGFMEVIVADNGSTDDTVHELEPLGTALFGKQFSCVRKDTNLGFAAACNAGAARATADLLFFLNNDTLPQKDWLKPLMRAPGLDPKLGAWGPLLTYPALLDEPERVQHLGVVFSPSLAHEHIYANFPASHPVTKRSRTLQAITGAAFMIPAALFSQCGGFHEGYKNGCEDLDLCALIRACGYKLGLVPESRITHLESMTPGRFSLDAQNAALLTQRRRGAFVPDLHRLARRDGYMPALTPWLHMYLRMRPERAQELDARAAADPSTEHLTRIITEEPLWEQGYTLLMHRLEREGHLARATRIATLRVFFFPLLGYYRDLLRLAARSENAQIQSEAARAMGAALSLLEDAPGLAARAAAFERWARETGEPELAALYAAQASAYAQRHNP